MKRRLLLLLWTVGSIVLFLRMYQYFYPDWKDIRALIYYQIDVPVVIFLVIFQVLFLIVTGKLKRFLILLKDPNLFTYKDQINFKGMKRVSPMCGLLQGCLGLRYVLEFEVLSELLDTSHYGTFAMVPITFGILFYLIWFPWEYLEEKGTWRLGKASSPRKVIAFMIMHPWQNGCQD